MKTLGRKCDVCGATEFREEWLSETFLVGDRRILVERVPARVCLHCATFSRETTEKVRRMVHGEGQPVGVVQMDVFEFV